MDKQIHRGAPLLKRRRKNVLDKSETNEKITWDCLLHGNVVIKHDLFYRWQIKYHDKSFTNYKYLHLYILGKGTMGNGTLGNGTFQNVSGEMGHSMLWEKGHFILWETGNSILWERFYPLGIVTLILWESDHFSSGIRDILWETGHAILWESDHLSSGKREILSSGNREIGNRFLTAPIHFCY